MIFLEGSPVTPIHRSHDDLPAEALDDITRVPKGDRDGILGRETGKRGKGQLARPRKTEAKMQKLCRDSCTFRN